jgi:membrane protease YdiL (CAAX protease family)
VAGKVTVLRDRAGPGPGEASAILAGLVCLEILVRSILPHPIGRVGGLWTLGAVRLFEIGLVGWYWRHRGWTAQDLGLRGQGARGWRVGAGFAAGMGVATLAVELASRGFGEFSFLGLLAGPRPTPGEWLPLLAVGAIIAPMFEELVFRGVLYAGLRRRLPAVAATLSVTVLFAAAHLPHSPIPWVQAVGGIVFCAAYELSGSLWAPLLVHSAGNAALFLLPLGF